tara:strand:- start:1198 stop:1467 length:270 start_codon:yes stop_codon:yes gene_type:complete
MLTIIVGSVVVALVAIKLLLHLKDGIMKKWREGFSFKENICYANSLGIQSCGPSAKDTVCRCKGNNLGTKIKGYSEDCVCPQATYPNFY